MITLAREGATYSDIAALYDCCAETVRAYLPPDIKPDRNLSAPIVGHGAQEFKQARRELFAKAKSGDPEAVMELANHYHLTGFWAAGVGTVIARHGFRASTCMVDA
jgi:hypothetical protein